MLKKAILSLSVLSILAVPVAAGAQSTFFNPDDPFGVDQSGSFGLGTADLKDTIVAIIQIALSFLGLLAVIIILWGGFQWLTAGGNEDRVASARRTLIAGIIGLVIILAAYAIATFVINVILEQTGGGQFAN